MNKPTKAAPRKYGDKYQRMILAVRGDTQGGHAGGLENPDTELPEVVFDPETNRRVVAGYYNPGLRPVQKQLWKWHEQDRQEIEKLAGPDPIVFLEMGDLTQGSVFKDDLKENSMSDQVIISQWNMKPWMEMRAVKEVFIVKGTGVHLWGESATETILTHFLRKEYPHKPLTLSHHYLLNVGGFLVDVAHHGPGAGIRNWTRGNVFDLYIKSILMDDLELGEPVPNAFLRAHFHEFTYGYAKHQVGGNIWEAPGWIIPPMCFIGTHAIKTTRSPSRMGVGMLALEIINGKLLQCHRFLHYVDLRTERIIQ